MNCNQLWYWGTNIDPHQKPFERIPLITMKDVMRKSFLILLAIVTLLFVYPFGERWLRTTFALELCLAFLYESLFRTQSIFKYVRRVSPLFFSTAIFLIISCLLFLVVFVNQQLSSLRRFSFLVPTTLILWSLTELALEIASLIRNTTVVSWLRGTTASLVVRLVCLSAETPLLWLVCCD